MGFVNTEWGGGQKVEFHKIKPILQDFSQEQKIHFFHKIERFKGP
jgi:hypothetical protein